MSGEGLAAAPRFGLSARLMLLTAALVIVSQIINAFILVTSERSLRQARFEAVVAERAVQALRSSERPGLRRPPGRRRGLRIAGEPPRRGDPQPSGEVTLAKRLEEEGFGERAVAVRLVQAPRGAVLVTGIALGADRWLVQLHPAPPERSVPLGPILLQTLVLGAALLIPAVWLSRRVATPLRQLTAAANGFLRAGSSTPLPAGGPPDIRALSAAFEALEKRVLNALDERAVMLGALGHDLRTPLAALRIEVESVSDDQQRAAMIMSIDRLAGALNDILALSSAARPQTMELVRTDQLLAELRALYSGDELTIHGGDHMSFHASPEAVLRALRNLIDNAVRYGGKAELEAKERQGGVAFVVLDRGPGLEPSELKALQQPFRRGENSRNLATGGSGLGLAIVNAVADAHQGSLELSRRAEGGLRAELVFPSGGTI